MKQAISNIWQKFKKLVDWFDTNARYFAAIFAIATHRWTLTVLLAVMVAFGILAPETAAKLKATVLGEDLAQQIEVIDNVG